MKKISNTIYPCRFKDAGISPQSGFAPMLIMVLISAVTLVIALNLAYIGQGDLDAGQAERDGSAAAGIADSCAENILSLLRNDSHYASNSLAFSIDGGSCAINVSTLNQQKEITVQSVFKDYYKKITFRADMASSGIEIYDWQEY